jgi:hypothetical protein
MLSRHCALCSYIREVKVVLEYREADDVFVLLKERNLNNRMLTLRSTLVSEHVFVKSFTSSLIS